MKKPVVFIIFNRPDTTAIVFEKIRKYQPKRLFVIADGPRPHKNNENQLCEETRSIIQIDWKCETSYIYSNINLGCQKRISSGLDEVFGEVEDAIILEDDCVPHDNFFRYCEQLLDEYKNEDRIMTISGTNFQQSNFEIDESCYVSVFPLCWGWATWRSAWSKMDVKMEKWKDVKGNDFFKDYGYDIYFEKYWADIFDRVSCGDINSWAYPWLFSCWYHKGLTIVPRKNLVVNIGFGEDATHTISDDELLANLEIYGLDFPLKLPTSLKRNFEADYYTSEYIFRINILKEHAMIDSMKVNLFRYLMDIGKLQDLFQTKIYIFGVGELGKMINNIVKVNGYSIERFIVSKPSEYNSKIDDIKVIDPSELPLEKIKIIVSIEGKHDRLIIENLKQITKGNLVEVLSWKDLK